MGIELSIAVVAFLINAVATWYVDLTGSGHFSRSQDIRDLGFLYVRPLVRPWDARVSTITLGIMVGLPAWAMLRSAARSRIFFDICQAYGLTTILRSIAICCTILPPPRYPVRRSAVELVLTGGEYDKIFSGHAAFSMVTTYVLVRHAAASVWTYLAPAIVSWSLIASRDHYTVDVYLGLVIGYLVSKLSVD